MSFSQPTVDTFRLGGIAMFFTWTHGPQRNFFENKVIHPFSFEMRHQSYFCPQLHRKRHRIKLRSLAWARHHKERLLFHPRKYAQHAVDVKKWQDSALNNK